MPGPAKPLSVLAPQIEAERQRIRAQFDGGATAYIEESWAKPGGMDDRAEVHGDGGVAYADLLHGNAIETYSKSGYGYAVEKAGEFELKGIPPMAVHNVVGPKS